MKQRGGRGVRRGEGRGRANWSRGGEKSLRKIFLVAWEPKVERTIRPTEDPDGSRVSRLPGPDL